MSNKMFRFIHIMFSQNLNYHKIFLHVREKGKKKLDIIICIYCTVGKSKYEKESPAFLIYSSYPVILALLPSCNHVDICHSFFDKIVELYFLDFILI